MDEVADGQCDDLSCLKGIVFFGFSLVMGHPRIIHNILLWSTHSMQHFHKSGHIRMGFKRPDFIHDNTGIPACGYRTGPVPTTDNGLACIKDFICEWQPVNQGRA